jgi:restriction system protein
MGLLTNSSRGVWALTDDGTALLTDPSATDDQRSERIQELRARYLTEMRLARKTRLPQDDGELDDGQPSPERSWKEQLLEQLMTMPPDAFERLARRLLREADFDSVNVTGQSVTAGSMDLASTGSGSSASRSSFSASDTAAVSAPAPFATSAVR